VSSILVKLTFKCNLGKTFSAKEALQANLLNDVFEETGQQFTDKVSDSLTLHSMHKIYSLILKRSLPLPRRWPAILSKHCSSQRRLV